MKKPKFNMNRILEWLYALWIIVIVIIVVILLVIKVYVICKYGNLPITEVPAWALPFFR